MTSRFIIICLPQFFIVCIACAARIFKLVQLIRGMARSIPRNKIFTENYTKSVNLKDKINVITQTKDATKLITSLKAERKSKEISELTPVKATKPKVEIKSSLAERNV